MQPDKSLGEESRYAYLFGRIKHLETKLITKDRFEKMLNAHDADGAIKIMAETSYGPFVVDGEPGTVDIEGVLMTELRRTYESLLPDVPERRYLDVFFIEYDIQNLKVLLKSRLSPGSAGEEDVFVNAGTLEKKKFINLLASDLDTITEAFPDYATDIKRAASMYEEVRDISVIDSALDAALYRRMAELSVGNWLLENIVTMQADVGNMKLVARAKNIGRERDRIFFLPGGTMTDRELTSLYDRGGADAFAPFAHRYGKIVPPALEEYRQIGSWLGLEKYVTDVVMETARGSRHVMGAEVLAGYILAKKLEIGTLRMIIISKLTGTPAERVRAVWSA
ncbi:MAG: hypothetical protein FP824_01875 [Euryarchaeota archaeon]|nr:hypothetical protein [Euryarchaeota archaeon]MBU4033145.1 V-type ATPase subunit [Candidatus Thermoplasmatota archaeon]MBU4072074.1 V-type ATPase subunit [Candidatus Thermoplasmatota archaeon]MBU4143384.1 V-type ATPase subunit [Candidatus Thermoplasmatota archaeon]